MGLLFSASGAGAKAVTNTRPSDEMLHRLECRACPLNRAKGLQTPKMQPTGAKEPVVYILGEFPDTLADDEGKYASGDGARFVKGFLDKAVRNQVRWNSTIRCATPAPRGERQRNPDKIETECCRPSIEVDIEDAAPEAIFGMGSYALSWAGVTGEIAMWRGRRFPVQVGAHKCWFYPMLSPLELLDQRSKRSWGKSDYEVAFQFDVNNALRELEQGSSEPIVHTVEDARKDVTCIEGRSSKDLNYVMDFLEYAGNECTLAGLDYETTTLRPYRKEALILTKAVSVASETLAFAWQHKEAGWEPAQLVKLEKAYIRFLKAPARKIVHNLSFEMEWSIFKYDDWENTYLDLARSVPWEDTQTQAFVLDERVGERKPGALALEFITQQYFGINIKKITKGLNKKQMVNEPLSAMLGYNAIDAKYHRLNYTKQRARLEAEGLSAVYQEKLEQVPTVVLSQLKGIPVDAETNRMLSEEYEAKIKKIEREIAGMPEASAYRKLTNQTFNPGSPHHVLALLKDVLKTRAGQEGDSWTTAESALSKIENPIADAIVRLRKVSKLKGTYVDPYSSDSSTVYPGNIIHTNFTTTMTATGRLASEDPNVQNIPIRTAEGRRARGQIQRRKGVVASFDYGQIDARGIASGSRDKAYCRAIWEDYDIHMEWAKRLATYYPKWVGGRKFINDPKALDEFRGAKVKSQWVFALFYTASLRTTATRFGVDPDFLAPQYDAFWKQFSGVKDWQDEVIKQFEELGYVQLFDGLRRRAPLGRGEIVNTPIQGLTNRITMHAMNRLSAMNLPQFQANMQIHDDLTFMFESEREFEDSADTIIDTMLDGRAFPWFCVPLSVEVKRGTSWEKMEKVGEYRSDKRIGWPVREREFM